MYGASFSVKTGQIPHHFPSVAQEGGSILIGALHYKVFKLGQQFYM